MPDCEVLRCQERSSQAGENAGLPLVMQAPLNAKYPVLAVLEREMRHLYFNLRAVVGKDETKEDTGY